MMQDQRTSFAKKVSLWPVVVALAVLSGCAEPEDGPLPAYVDTVPATVSLFGISNGNPVVNPRTPVGFYFSEEMDEASVESAFSLQKGSSASSGATLPFTAHWLQNWVDMEMTTPLDLGTTHSAALAGSATDVGGQAIAAKSFSFTTAPIWTPIVTGSNHTLAMDERGDFWGWGSNNSGQLAQGEYDTEYTAPARIFSRFAVSAAGTYFSLGIKRQGTLWAWGRNEYGTLGLGHLNWRNEPVQVGTLTSWRQVVAGNYSAFGILSDGTLWAWGRNDHSQLGLGHALVTSAPEQVGSNTTWSAVSPGRGHTLALRTDGSLWVWGTNSYYDDNGTQILDGQLGLGNNWTGVASPTQLGSNTGWSAVAAGRLHSLALRSDGTLWAWGRNFDGQLGVGDKLSGRTTPTQVGTNTTWSAIAAGEYHSLALRSDGTLWAWGDNSEGELGLGLGSSSDNDTSTPTQVGSLTTWMHIAAGGFSSFAMLTDYSFWAWGWNDDGQLGMGNTTGLTRPTLVK